MIPGIEYYRTHLARLCVPGAAYFATLRLTGSLCRDTNRHDSSSENLATILSVGSSSASNSLNFSVETLPKYL
jgi:hypothetical protein